MKWQNTSAGPIQCKRFSDAFTLDAIAGYGTASTAAAPVAESVANVTISENVEKDGIEIRFPSKPSADILQSLKSHGWRWSRFSQCWYARRSAEARSFAESLTGTAAPSQANDAPDVDAMYEEQCKHNCGL